MKPLETIRDVVENSLSSYAELDAYRVFGGEEWSFRQIGGAIHAVQARLSKTGVSAGDRVAVLGENQPGWSTSYLAITSAGAVAVPILPDFSPVEIAEILSHADARVMILSEKQQAKLTQSKIDLSARTLITMEQLFADALHAGVDGPTYLAPVDRDTTAAIIYTSGTTGHSKGVVLSHGNITSNAQAADQGFAGVFPGARMLSVLPLAHTYECTIGMVIPFLCGASVTYLKRQVSPTLLVKALAEVRPHFMLSVPILIEKLVRSRIVPSLSKMPLSILRRLPLIGGMIYRAAGKKLVAAFGGRLQFFGIGGAALAADVERILRKIKFPYAIGYGLTETSPLLAGAAVGKTVLRSTGLPTPGVDVRVIDGEIQAKGPNIMKGYYRDPQRTAEVMTEDGWFRTGDLGAFDAKGRLFVKGRLKTVIVGSNGENIYPETIEAIINQCRGVMESLVIKKGNRLVANVRIDYERLAEQLKSLSDSAREMLARADAAANATFEAVGRAGGDAVRAGGDAMREVRDAVNAYLEEVRQEVNAQLSSFSRLAVVCEQVEPFEKTPTLKIKRYLYQ